MQGIDCKGDGDDEMSPSPTVGISGSNVRMSEERKQAMFQPVRIAGFRASFSVNFSNYPFLLVKLCLKSNSKFFRN